jgi:hypothetical protein
MKDVEDGLYRQGMPKAPRNDCTESLAATLPRVRLHRIQWRIEKKIIMSNMIGLSLPLRDVVTPCQCYLSHGNPLCQSVNQA